MQPIYINLEKISELKFIEKDISKINEISICKNSNDIKPLSQVLKNQLDLFVHKHKKAKGEIKTNTFIIIYLKE